MTAWALLGSFDWDSLLTVLAAPADRPGGAVEPVDVIAEHGGIELAQLHHC